MNESKINPSICSQNVNRQVVFDGVNLVVTAPIVPLSTEQTARFWSKVKKQDSGCWEWCGKCNGLGYGVFEYNGSCRRAHRISYVLQHGSLPDGMCVLHRCDNPKCVNPDHLWLGTKKQNSEDMVSKRRQARYETYPEYFSKWRGNKNPKHLHPESVTGENNPAAKLNVETVTMIRSLFNDGVRQFDIARRFGLTRFRVHDIVRFRIWNVLQKKTAT